MQYVLCENTEPEASAPGFCGDLGVTRPTLENHKPKIKFCQSDIHFSFSTFSSAIGQFCGKVIAKPEQDLYRVVPENKAQPDAILH